MDSITLENFRCFRERQTARLAPLTLLVGENSTGKTSFLAAVRIASQLAERRWHDPDFKETPYDLGSFDEIAHHRGGPSRRAESFGLGHEQSRVRLPDGRRSNYRIRCTFTKRASAPSMSKRRIELGDSWIEEEVSHKGTYKARLGTERGIWQFSTDDDGLRHGQSFGDYGLASRLARHRLRQAILHDSDTPFVPQNGAPPFGDDERHLLEDIDRLGFRPRHAWPFASAPVRSKPQRTYNPARLDPDPEGDYIPMYFADMALHSRDEWLAAKSQLEQFGVAAGLFDEITVRPLGKTGSDPFQIQVRKGGKNLKGAFRNLLDVGYGISQVLPIVTELIASPDPTSLYLLQQPEVHLHPSAQAALGTLFCDVASPRRQLIVETHSDHLIDRVRMDVRDKTTSLKPEDVSLLYFERTGLDICIHSLRFDKLGNVLNAPPGYRQFFMQEVERSIWPPK